MVWDVINLRCILDIQAKMSSRKLIKAWERNLGSTYKCQRVSIQVDRVRRNETTKGASSLGRGQSEAKGWASEGDTGGGPQRWITESRFAFWTNQKKVPPSR